MDGPGAGRHPRNFKVLGEARGEHDRRMNAEQQFETDRALPDVRQLLLQLARREEELAAEEAAVLPYWRTCVPSVEGHRVAAAALRWAAEQFPIRYPNRGEASTCTLHSG
jgi:hypothetical protein